MKKSESKYFNTAVRMDRAFLELLEKKDMEYITVKEICEAAGVNRSTFYLHYETIDDLLAESVQYMNQQFSGTHEAGCREICFKNPGMSSGRTVPGHAYIFDSLSGIYPAE